MEAVRRRASPHKHFLGIGFVILFHVVLVYALISGLARKVVEVIKQPLETKIIEEVRLPPPPEPPVQPPKLAAPPPPFIPAPEINIAPPPAPQTTIAVSTAAPPSQPAISPAERSAEKPAGTVRVAPVIDALRSCEQPQYPAASRRAEEIGTVTLKFLIDLDGKVVKSEVEESSGHSRLDEAARNALSRCRFKPGTLDGKPEQSWARLKFVWKLT